MAKLNDKGKVEFERNDKIKTQELKDYVIENSVDGGGEGFVYKAYISNNKNKKYALKILYSDESYNKAKRLYKHYFITPDKFPDFVLPIDLFSYTFNGQTVKGYVADYVGQSDISKALGTHENPGFLRRDSIATKCKVLRSISDAIKPLSDNGWAYSDISPKNIRIDGKADRVYFIDCEGICPHNEVVIKKGTGVYMAPEVAFGRRPAGQFADFYAFAMLSFLSLIGEYHSPYMGKTVYIAQVNPYNMFEYVGRLNDVNKATEHLKFIFDRSDQSNALRGSMPPGRPNKIREQQEIINRVLLAWNKMPDELKPLFVRAFKNPFDTSYQEDRPNFNHWSKAFTKIIGDGGNTASAVSQPVIGKPPIKTKPSTTKGSAKKTSPVTSTLPKLVKFKEIWLLSSHKDMEKWNAPFSNTDNWRKFTPQNDGTYLWTGEFNGVVYFRFFAITDHGGYQLYPNIDRTNVVKNTNNLIQGLASISNNAWIFSNNDGGKITIIVNPSTKTFMLNVSSPLPPPLVIIPSPPPVVAPSAPGAPSLIRGREQLGISWSAVNGATEYELYYGTSSNSTRHYGTYKGTSATISGLTSDTEYYVRLKAKNTGGDSGYGPYTSAKTQLNFCRVCRGLFFAKPKPGDDHCRICGRPV